MPASQTVPPATAESPLRFGRFQINAAERLLLVNGQPAAVGARAFDLLLALAQRRERLVGRQELLDLVWPGVVVEEHNITAQISSLRKLLAPNVIATVPGRGYQFVASPDVSDPVPPSRPADTALSRHNLPEQRTRFVGRAAELAELDRLLPQTRLLTLTGIGGAGKTRLALQLAQQQRADFADGVWFVDLAPIADADRVAPACAAALGLDLQPSEVPSPDRLAILLAQRQALVVLDNCEHVRSGAAAVANALLARPGAARIIATSREPLAVAGEQIYPLRSLSLPTASGLEEVRAADAVRVFVDRARLVVPDFDVDSGNAATLAEICRRLDGIALAIELAAARITVLSVSDIAARLEDRFRLLTGGHAAAARQQTLLATMHWSHDLLEPAAQRLLRRFAVFAGGATLEAASAITQSGDEYETLAWLSQLHDKSLLVVDRGAPLDSAARPRYRMLETMRQYALQRLEESGDADATRARHAEHFLAQAEAAAPFLRGPQQSLWMARLRAEHENLIVAMAWWSHDPSGPARDTTRGSWGLRLAAASGRYWLFNDVELGCRLLLEALHRAPPDADDAARFKTLQTLASMHMHRGQGAAGLPHAQAALAVAEQLGHAEWQALALGTIGSCMDRGGGDDEAALHHYRRSADLARASASAVPLAAALNNIANIEFRNGNLQAAAQGFRQALHVSRGSGDVRSTLIELHNLMRVLVAARDHDAARECAIEAELMLRGVQEHALKLELLEVAGGLASSRNEHAFAARLWGSTLQRYHDLGYTRPEQDQALLEHRLAQSRQALGDTAFAAAEAAGRALEVDAATQELRQWLECRPGGGRE